MGEQGHHEYHGPCRRTQSREDGPFAGAEGFVTLMADEALLLMRMDTNIALAGLASGMTVLMGTEYGRGVHDAPPGCAWKHCHEQYVWTPVCFTTAPLHGLVQSYHLGDDVELFGCGEACADSVVHLAFAQHVH